MIALNKEHTMSELTKTIPATWYYEPSIFEKERKEIFAKEWIYVAEEMDLQNKGDYLTVEIAGYPLMLVVGGDQKIRAFHNVCRHRAAPLLTEKKGQVKSSLTCRYHGWTYDLSGKLAQAPFCDASQMSACDFSLLEVQIGLFNGLIFVNLDPKAIPFSDAYKPICDEVSRSGYKMLEYNVSATMTKVGAFNWKVWMDGFQECYHCMTIHPVLKHDFSLQKYRIENKEKYSLHSCERKTQSELGSFPGLWLWVYPNLGLPCYEPCFYTLQVNPISATQTQLNYRFRFHQTVTADKQNEFIAMIEKITMEDMFICEHVQKNLSAGVFKEGYLNTQRENGVEYFHSLVREAVV